MHEGKTKLALRGTTAIDLGGDKQKATCQKDDSWKQASPLLLTYAEAQWKKFEKEF